MAEEDPLATALERQMRLDSDDEAADRSHAEDERHPFDESMDSDAKAQNFQSRRVISLGQLPPLPPADSESELFEDDADYDERSDGHMDTVDESQMQRHLDNVDSSFLSAPSFVGKHGDDEGSNGSTKPGDRRRNGVRTPDKERRLDGIAEESSILQSENSPCAGRELSRHDDMSAINSGGESTTELETMSSSPTAAAAARTFERVISMASMGYDVAGHEVGTYDDRSDSDQEGRFDEDVEHPSGMATPRAKSRAAQVDGNDDSDSGARSNLRHQESNESLNAKDAGRTPGQALRKRAVSRPGYLRSRNNSQRSSISTTVPMHIQPDDEYGADYAVLSGGSMPQNAPMTRHPSQMLSRTISLGSIASGIDEDYTPVPTPFETDKHLEPLDEEGLLSPDVKSEPETTKDFLETPKPTRSLAPPTDTVIARHVRSVHVPDSVAKEYTNRPGVSPVRTSAAMRQGRNMTLKEQSSTIERLSKENFDLKLKVMFLSERLDKLSEEGVKEMISENVELKTVLANLQRDNKALRKKVKDLEKGKDDEMSRPTTADTNRSGASSDGPQQQWFHQENEERQKDIEFLRERIEEYEVAFENMRNESLARENEKRRLAEIVKTMSNKRGEDMDAREEMDVWKDLLEQETARREQSDEDNRKLRDEIFKLKSEGALSQSGRQSAAAAGGSMSGLPAMNHTTNIYNITKKRQMSPSRPISNMSEHPDLRGGAFSSASTLVEELRNESERLRHENAELKREVGAQTSMLTSRNREKERLYQEIEDLKLGHRRGSIAGDSILERSASRSHQRPISRGSAMTRMTNPPEVDIEELEMKNADLRDNLNALKLSNQELQKELDSCMQDFETAIQAKRDAEALVAELEGELQATSNDLITMQTERDEALRNVEDLETEFESLRKEAQDEIDALEAEAEQRMAQMDSLQLELTNTTENFNALQNEMREMSEAVVRLEDDHDVKSRRIQELEKEVEDGNRELDEMEKAIVEAREKISRLEVQQESSQGEIAFLREEQDSDKVKIGDLETSIKNAESQIRDEKERVRELEQRLQSEREQREVVAGQEKQEVQRYINDLNREASGAKDEARRLRKSLSSREVEATEWKERLLELEDNLRQALGDLNGTRSSFVKGITDLQRQLDDTTRELLATRDAIIDKERVIKQRDNLLENHGLESRKLADMLEKERQAHRSTRHQHENSLQAQHHTTRTVSQQEARVLQLENALSHDRKKLAQVENAFKDAMLERNNLLLALWNRLSGICGSDWAHNNSLINGRALPSMEAISGQMFGGFAKNLVASVKMVESIILGFRAKIKTVEKQLWKEMQNLESTLEQRTTKLERLEALVKSQAMGGPGSHGEQKSEISRLQNLNRLLRAELAANRGNSPRKSSLASSASPNSGVAQSISHTNLKHYTVETVPELGSPSPVVPMGPGAGSTHKNNRPQRGGLSRGYSEANLHSQSAIPLPPLERASTTSAASVRSGKSANSATPSKTTRTQTETNPSDFGASTSTYRGIGPLPHQERTGLRKGLDEGLPEGLSSEEAWEWRMQEMERRLREEREGRRLDRRNAQRRLEEEGRARREVEEERRRERGRGGAGGGSGGEGRGAY